MRNGVHWCVSFSVASLMLGGLPALAAGNDGLTGQWARDDGGTRIEIVVCGQEFCATNIWVKDPGGKERVGDKLILSLEPVSNSVLKGQAYDVRRKIDFKIAITLQQTSMSTTGCVFFGIICRSAEWTRTN